MSLMMRGIILGILLMAQADKIYTHPQHYGIHKTSAAYGK